LPNRQREIKRRHTWNRIGILVEAAAWIETCTEDRPVSVLPAHFGGDRVKPNRHSIKHRELKANLIRSPRHPPVKSAPFLDTSSHYRKTLARNFSILRRDGGHLAAHFGSPRSSYHEVFFRHGTAVVRILDSAVIPVFE
jgi:hypothetical protein